MSIPADVASRLAAMFARMGTRGMTETVEVHGATTQLNQASTPIARKRGILGTIAVYVAMGGGSQESAQEGSRAGDIHPFGFLPDGSGLLTEANYKDRQLKFPARDGAYYRVTLLQAVGPYLWGIAERGGTADVAGGTK